MNIFFVIVSVIVFMAVGSTLFLLNKTIQGPMRSPTPSMSQKPNACITLYQPVCGKNGKTYSNSCFAEMAGIKVEHEGKCDSSETQRAFPAPVEISP